MHLDQRSGWWMPDGEEYLAKWLDGVGLVRDGKLMYQRFKYLHAKQRCEQTRHAVDVGAHIGLWSWQMSLNFQRVTAFEPVPEFRQCWTYNMQKRNNDGRVKTKLNPAALGEREGEAMVCWDGDHSMKAHIDSGGSKRYAKTVVRTLDSYGLKDVDLLKIDVEGYELFVLRGAAETISRWRPVIIVEQKPHNAERYGQGQTAAADHLVDKHAYRFAADEGGDFIMVPK